MATQSPIVVICTGCSSGLGLLALKDLVSNPPSPNPFHLIIGSRSPTPSSELAALSETAKTNGHQVTILSLELSDLKSVKAFVEEVLTTLEPGGKVDVVLLCAGLYKAQRTQKAGGWSEEAIVNHFAQHYLLHLLSPHLASEWATNKSRVVVVSSNLHYRVRSLDNVTALLKCAGPVESGEPMKRYSASKFVQMIGAQWWRRNLPSTSRVVAVTPGFIPQTGLNRESSYVFRFILHYFVSWAPFCSTPAQGAAAIARAITWSDAQLDEVETTKLQEEARGNDHESKATVLYLNNTVQALRPDGRTNEDGLEEWTPSVEVMESWRS